MKETLYLNKELAILNYSAGYARNPEQLLKSSTFSNYVHNFIDYLKEADEDLYYYVINGKTARESTVELIKLFRMLRIFKIDEIESPYFYMIKVVCWNLLKKCTTFGNDIKDFCYP